MKKWMTLTLTLFVLLALTACGGSGGKAENETKDVDLTEVYASMEEVCDWWADGYMEDIPTEMLDLYYPGLSELETEQMIVKAAAMSAVANEVALVKCQSEEDADKAAEIFQARIDYQVGDDENIGGAFYPESIESWKKASVQRQGNCVALVAVDGKQGDLENVFNQAFT